MEPLDEDEIRRLRAWLSSTDDHDAAKMAALARSITMGQAEAVGDMAQSALWRRGLMARLRWLSSSGAIVGGILYFGWDVIGPIIRKISE